MSLRLVTLAIVAAAFLGGCSTPSVHPVWSKEKNLTDAALVGDWRPAEKDSDERYSVTREGDFYRLVYSKNDAAKERREFDVRLAQLGKYRFADVTATESGKHAVSDEWDGFFLCTHMFVRYSIDGDHLRIWCLDRDKLKKGIQGKRFSLACTDLDEDSVLITAETPELQSFLEKHAEDDGLFNAADLDRVKP